jgi:hypothetical protein
MTWEPNMSSPLRNLCVPAAAVIALATSAAGCGGTSAGTPHRPTTAPATTAAAAAPVTVTITSPTHRPKTNIPWPVTITVTDAADKPLRARLTMNVLFNGAPVGKIDNGAHYDFVGTWQEKKGNEITWPPEARGQPLTFQAVVTAKGRTVKKTWWIQVR